MGRRAGAYGGRGMDDSTLVEQALAGDRTAVAALYDRYADRLYDYARRLTNHPADAADAVHDGFMVAMQRLSQLRDPAKVRPWLYAIVRSEVHRRHRRVNRLQFGVWDDPVSEPVSTDLAPSTAAEITELQQLIAAAADGLSDDDREVLDLHLRHGLQGAELAAALAIPERHAGVTLQRVRERLARGLGVVLVGRAPTCPEFIALQRTNDTPAGGPGGTAPAAASASASPAASAGGPELTELGRKRLARHIDGCTMCSTQRDARLRPELLLGALPMALAPAALRARTVEPAAQTLAHWLATPPASQALPTVEAGRRWLTDGFPTLAGATRRGMGLWLLAGSSATLLLGGTLWLARGGDSERRVTAPTTAAANKPAPADTGSTTGDTTIESTPVDTATPEDTVAASTTAAVTTTTTTTPATVTTPSAPAVPPPTSPPTTPPDGTAPTIGSAKVAVTRISSQAPAGFGTCEEIITTRFEAPVSDAVGVTSVSGTFQAPGGAVRPFVLTHQGGGVWAGTVGPFPFAEVPVGDLVKYTVVLTAHDAAGNIGQRTFAEVAAVESCPIVT